MGGKRRAQPAGNAQGKAAANGGAAAAQGGSSCKRQTLGQSVNGAAALSVEARPESSRSLQTVTVSLSLSIQCEPSAVGGSKAALEAALLKAVAEFGGQNFKLEMRVGPSEDTLQRVLPLVLELVGPEAAGNCFTVCKSWRGDMEARGVCRKTVQLCSTLAGGGNVERLGQHAQRRLDAGTGDAERDMFLDANSFLQKSIKCPMKRHDGWSRIAETSRSSFPGWLQAASQEPDTSFLARGSASTAQILGLPLVRWVGKPERRYPGMYSLAGHGKDLIASPQPTFPHCVFSIAVSPDGKRFFSGSKDSLVKIWNAETGDEVGTLAGNTGEVSSVTSSSDGRFIVSKSSGKNRNDGALKIWDAATGAEVCSLTGDAANATAFALSPDGKNFVTGSDDGVVKIWDTATGQQVRAWRGHSSYISAIAFSPDGKFVVSGSWDSLSSSGTPRREARASYPYPNSTKTFVVIWNAATGEEMHELMGHGDNVNAVAFSPDGTLVVSGSDNQSIIVWNAETGDEILCWGEHHNKGLCLCTVDDEGEPETDERGEPILHPGCPLTAHSGPISRVTFSHDGAQVISGCEEDNTVIVWDVASGVRVNDLAGAEFALVEGLSNAHKRDRWHILTALGDMLLIYECGKDQQHAGNGAAAAPVALGAMAPVARFKAPQRILSVRCHGAAICVGCVGGAVCVLSAPFLAD